MAISDLQQPPILVYRVDFTGSTVPPEADIDVLSIPDQLVVATSGRPDEDAHPRPGLLANSFKTIQPNGLELAITRSPAAASAQVPTGLLCGLGPIPKAMRRFRISADFVMEGVMGEPGNDNDTWAASVFVRDGEQMSTLDAKIVGATQQVVTQTGGDVQITLGAGMPTKDSLSPKAMNTQVPWAAVYDPYYSNHGFTLAAYVDCHSGTGQSQLTTASGYHWENSWTHPFVAPELGVPLRYALYFGFGLAMTKKSGPRTARVFVRKFSVLNWPMPLTTPVGPVLGGSKEGQAGPN